MKNYELRITNYELRLAKIFFALSIFCGAIISINAQSTDADYPTPVTSNEISGTIRARDIGDARLTSYYYVFNGSQGDIFVNIETRNLNGDIDIFAAEGLRPLSKIRLYADSSQSETGRIVYLRKPDKLILRVEGRTPDDNPALFRIKFAGSFVAYAEGTETGEPAAPKVESAEQGNVKVNSVGTIIESKEERSADEKEKVAETKQPETSTPLPEPPTETTPKSSADKTADENNSVEPTVSKTTNSKAKRIKTPVRNKKTSRVKPVKNVTAETTEKIENPPANPLENVRLIVLMKDGAKVEYPMTEVFRFSLNNNVLTIILKGGKIERRSILDIQKFSVE